MTANHFESANYITLRQFQGGWIWLKNIDEASTRIIPVLHQLSLENVRRIAEALNAEVLPWKIFDNTQWVIRITPLPDFIILIVFNHDEEFGSDLKIFYHRSSLQVPTEDAYVFTEIFLEFLGTLAKSALIKTEFEHKSDEIIRLSDLLARIDPSTKEKMWNDLVGQREVPLLQIDKDTASMISEILKAQFSTGVWQNIKIDWGIQFKILRNLELYIVLPEEKTRINVYYSKNVLNFDFRWVLFFVYLYCNAIIREARKILGDALPKLSDYL